MIYERDEKSFPADAYRIINGDTVAWHVLGWEIKLSNSRQKKRTGKVVAVMVGDYMHFSTDPERLEPIKNDDYCGSCGQIGCGHG